MKKYILALVAAAVLSGSAFAGGEVPESPIMRQPAPAAPAAPAPRAPGKATRIKSSELHRWTKLVPRNAPLPAPGHPMGSGSKLDEFYGPTYYYPFEHNVYEGLHPTYYPFTLPKGWANYKAPGNYCLGKLCGPSRSMHYWDHYDDWKRGERYEQKQY